jgi:uncharacterized SAM-dependent methyltransferase
MRSVVQVTIDSSQFPEAVTRDLLDSLRLRQVNHKFHYDSVKQANRWLALHRAYSPSCNEIDCTNAYVASFSEAANQIANSKVHVIALGCGGGQKETRLLETLRHCGKEPFYTPCDVSLPLALVALQSARSIVPQSHCFPLVCDLATAQDLSTTIDAPYLQFLKQGGAKSTAVTATDGSPRLFTFFGIIPNFEPKVILPKLAELLRADDYLLFSANLAPGPDYASGVNRILPQYDNDLTRRWLLTFLFDLGVEPGDGKLRFVVESGSNSLALKRIAVYFDFTRQRCIQIGAESFAFAPNDTIRLFFSYRHTPALTHKLLGQYGLKVLDQWISSSQEEGVFLAKK